MGGANEIARETGAVVRASEEEAAPLIAGDDTTIGGSWIGRPLAPLEVEPLAYDTRLEAGAAPWKVLHTPGHTIGSLSLFHEDSGALISGDTVFTNGSVGRWDLPTGDFDALVASIKALEKLSPAHLYPGHGPYSEGDAAEHIRMALELIDVAAVTEGYG